MSGNVMGLIGVTILAVIGTIVVAVDISGSGTRTRKRRNIATDERPGACAKNRLYFRSTIASLAIAKLALEYPKGMFPTRTEARHTAVEAFQCLYPG